MICTQSINELKNLIASAVVTIFIVNEENAKGIGAIEEKSPGMYHQRFMLPSGHMIDAVSN